MRDEQYPFGKLTIPWYLAGAILAVWSFGPLYVYHLSFAAESEGWGRGGVGTQDMAGYLGFGFVGLFTVAAMVALAIVHRRTFRLSFPDAKGMVEPFVVSTSILAAPYGGVALYYDQFRSRLPYDSNWAAISGICFVGFAHFILFTALVKQSSRAGDPLHGDAE